MKKITTGILLGVLSFLIQEGQAGLYGLINLNPHHLGNIFGSIVGAIFLVYIVVGITNFFRKRAR